MTSGYPSKAFQPPTHAGVAVPFLDIDKIIGDREIKIIICCGSGGVGKTTTSAAIALRAAEAGRKVVVLTIDPARRLAQSLGVGELDNTPRPVPMIDTAAGGSLDAMMLDMKNTFDDVVIAHSTPEKAEAILQNQFYVALSSEFSGTQEYMAMEKLGQLHSEAEANGTWDLIVVDTPPARSALDFLDAPEHLSSLLDGQVPASAAATGTRPAAFDERRLLHDVGGDHQDPRLPDHQRREDLCSRVRGTLRWIPAASDGNLPAVVLTAQHVPGRRHTAA